MKYNLLINIKMPTINGISLPISGVNFMLRSVQQEKNVENTGVFMFISRIYFMLNRNEQEKKYLGPRCFTLH